MIEFLKKWHLPLAAILALCGLALVLQIFGNRGAEKDPAGVAADDGVPPPPRRDRVRLFDSRGSEVDKPLISDRLAPGLTLEEGLIDGSEIKGPIKISGTLVTSKLNTSVGSDGNGASYSIEHAEMGEMDGAFWIEASHARATRSGVRFTGPIRLVFESDVGRWYEVVFESEEASFYTSKSGKIKTISAPDSGQFKVLATHPDP